MFVYVAGGRDLVGFSHDFRELGHLLAQQVLVFYLPDELLTLSDFSFLVQKNTAGFLFVALLVLSDFAFFIIARSVCGKFLGFEGFLLALFIDLDVGNGLFLKLFCVRLI